jgi:preprotein translocase subunit SecD
MRRLRLFGGITLAGVVLYVSMIATAFFGDSDVAMPFLPEPQAGSDAGRPLPGNAPAPPDPMQPGLAQPDEPAASETPPQPEPSPAPTAAPAPAPVEPTPDAPGRSETAPGQTNAPEPSEPQRP